MRGVQPDPNGGQAETVTGRWLRVAAALLWLLVLAASACKREEVGARLRRECDSIVREAHPEWEGRPIFEKAISACIMKRGAGLDP